jgi:Arc/MetJ-type ribon-helix-helix transcriptional regulator
MTNVIPSVAMAEQAISVRLDAEAERALRFLMRGGTSRSEAIRSALLTASRAARYDQMAADAKRLAGNSDDRALVADLQEFFDEL